MTFSWTFCFLFGKVEDETQVSRQAQGGQDQTEMQVRAANIVGLIPSSILLYVLSVLLVLTRAVFIRWPEPTPTLLLVKTGFKFRFYKTVLIHNETKILLKPLKTWGKIYEHRQVYISSAGTHAKIMKIIQVHWWCYSSQSTCIMRKYVWLLKKG